MSLDRPTDDDVAHVLAHAWGPQRAEISAFLRHGESVQEYGDRLVRQSVITHAWYFEDRPYCVGGMWLEGRDIAGTWMAHTDQALNFYPLIVMGVRRVMRRMALDAGVTTFQATTLEHDRTERFYRALGMKKVRDLPGHGSNGETLALYERRGVN